MSAPVPLADERALQRLGFALVNGRMYLINGPSAGLEVSIQPICEPSAALALKLNKQCCVECGDELPPGACYCISCSAPVAATGRTERL